jgi:lysophospholipase L1-like esterase
VYSRYVALGDSTTEGMDDPRPDGTYRGWADRLAERLATDNPGLLYANLAVRGRRTYQVREEQLAPALAFEPDIATVFSGLNDLLRRRYDPDETAGHVEAMFSALRATGATVLTLTMPDLSRIIPYARIVRSRLLAYNDAIRAISAQHGVLVLDLAAEPVTVDPRLWSVDRLHASTLGHERIAAGLCGLLALDQSGPPWSSPLPPAQRRRRHALVAAELMWAQRYFTPWVVRRIRGRSSGDGRLPKRPQLSPVD